ncbi:MAG: phosphohistidine phosphatase SixA [Succinivibrionaceae bacterium]|nr:phosphohistidine phosphatase SixA [Succinivibrionaceae bacterium]
MIVIVRHGHAEAAAVSDRNRLLTDRGMVVVRQRAEDMKKRCAAFDVTLASPYMRALQTLDLIKETVDPGKVQITDELEPDAPAQVADFLRYLDEEGKNVLAVSHMPLVCNLVAELSGPVGMGVFDPGDFYVLEKKPGENLYKVTYTTNSFSLM